MDINKSSCGLPSVLMAKGYPHSIKFRTKAKRRRHFRLGRQGVCAGMASAAMSWLFGNGAVARREREAREAEHRRRKLVAAGLLDNHPQGTPPKQFVQDTRSIAELDRKEVTRRLTDQLQQDRRNLPPVPLPPYMHAPPTESARERAELSNKARRHLDRMEHAKLMDRRDKDVLTPGGEVPWRSPPRSPPRPGSHPRSHSPPSSPPRPRSPALDAQERSLDHTATSTPFSVQLLRNRYPAGDAAAEDTPLRRSKALAGTATASSSISRTRGLEAAQRFGSAQLRQASPPEFRPPVGRLGVPLQGAVAQKAARAHERAVKGLKPAGPQYGTVPSEVDLGESPSPELKRLADREEKLASKLSGQESNRPRQADEPSVSWEDERYRLLEELERIRAAMGLEAARAGRAAQAQRGESTEAQDVLASQIADVFMRNANSIEPERAGCCMGTPVSAAMAIRANSSPSSTDRVMRRSPSPERTRPSPEPNESTPAAKKPSSSDAPYEFDTPDIAYINGASKFRTESPLRSKWYDVLDEHNPVHKATMNIVTAEALAAAPQASSPRRRR